MKSKSRSQTPFIKKYLKVSSIHGFKHLVLSKNRLEKLLWLNIIIVATSGASYISYLTITRYIQNPTVTTIERNHFSWDTNFPAATICPTAKINEKMVHDLTEYSTVSNKSLFYEFMLALAAGTYDNFDQIPYFDELEKEQYITLLLEMQYEFKPVFRTSTGVELKLQQVITEMGICYSVNTNLGIYSSPSYWENDQWDIVEEQDIFKVNFLDGESFIEVLNITSGFKIFFHGPYEVADIVSKGVTSSNGYSLKLSLKALSITSSNLTKSLNHNQRKCRFYYENNLKHFPIYSYVMCRMECRISLAKKLCGCVPHFYRRIGIEEVCGVIDLHCLAKYKERLILVKGECSCLPNCEYDNYYLDQKIIAINENNMTELRWGIINYPKMRLKRDVIFGFGNLLINIGGMFGLFLGCSFLSIVEIIYYFSLRFSLHLKKELH